MRVGALCAGYGGLELALARLVGDVELVWYAEIDRDSDVIATLLL